MNSHKELLEIERIRTAIRQIKENGIRFHYSDLLSLQHSHILQFSKVDTEVKVKGKDSVDRYLETLQELVLINMEERIETLLSQIEQ